MYFRENDKEIKVKDGLPPNKRELTPQRAKILEKAFQELRAARGKMNPAFLAKIRDMVVNNPSMIKALGLKKTEVENMSKETVVATVKAADKKLEQPQKETKPQQQPVRQNQYEKIDQAKNMDVLSKLLEINPDKKDMIKKMLSEKK